ncbi:MAG: beta strand repeat-containing protein, partial [Planctomycetaceae bacterium]
TATFSNSSAANGKTVIAGILSGWSLAGADAGNYTLTSVANTTANITKRDLIVTATASNKTYDRTTTASVTLSTDELAIDVGTLSVTFGAANFVDANAGDGKTVNVTGLNLSGVGSGNYQLPAPSVTTTANITKAGVTLSFTVEATKTYDGGTSATVTGSNILGVLGDDIVTVSGVTATYDTKSVGTNKPVTATGTLGGAQGGNYQISSVTPRTANITAKSITATFTAANRTYDGTTAATIAGSNFVGTVVGDTVSLTGTATFDNKNVGTNKAVTLTSPGLSGADAGNYTLTGSVPSTTANITVRTVTPVFTADNKLYDGTTDATLTFVSDDRVAVDAGEAKLSYTYTATFADSAIGTWTVSVTGITPVGTESANYVVNSPTQTSSAEILPIPNNPPEVETTSGTITYTKLQPGVIVDAGVTVTDTDSADFDTGYLQVTITNELSTGDVLAISSQGTGTGQISVTGANVFYQGTQIGTITQNGSGGNALVVTLNAAANAVNVQALARRVTFANTESVPSTLTRTIQFEVNDGDGGTSSGATKDVSVLLGNVPVVTTSAGATTFTEGGASIAPAITIDGGITVTDVDTTVFNNGSLTVSFAANGTADDRLTIRNVNYSGGFNLDGDQVRYVTSAAGVTTYTNIGTWAGGTGTTPLVVSFNSNATVALVQSLARNIMFQNVSQAPVIEDRSVSFVVSDGNAGASIAALKTVRVVGTNDLPTLSGIATTATYNRGTGTPAPAVVMAPNGVPTDPDGTGYTAATPWAFFNCQLRVRITSGGNTADRLGISTGSGVTFTGTTAGEILVSSVKIGTYTLSSGSSATLLVTFLNDGSATQSRIQTLLRSVTFSTTRSTVSGTVNLRYEIGEAPPFTPPALPSYSFSAASNVSITVAP